MQPLSAAAARSTCAWSQRPCIEKSGTLTLYPQHRLPSDKISKEAWWYPFAKMACGAAAGAAAQTCSYPIDTLRRRMQMAGMAMHQAPTMSVDSSSGASGSGRPGRQRMSYTQLLHKLAGEPHGLLRSLFRGWTLNCVKVAPGAAVQFVVYDALRVAVTSLDPASGAQSPL